jgi:hypothetical protein
MTLQEKIEKSSTKTNLDPEDLETTAEPKQDVVKTENKENEKGYGILIVAVLTVVILWFLNWILLLKFGGNDAEKGQFGDMFGSVNALFSGLAFAFLIYTIWLQREELKLQREELKLQRKAVELQVDELKRQADELVKTVVLQTETLNLQKQHIEISERQIEKERIRIEEQNEPKFMKIGITAHEHTRQVILRLRNVGADAYSVRFSSNEYLQNNDKTYYDCRNGEEMNLSWFYRHEEIPQTVDLMISYENSNRESKTISGKMKKLPEAKSIEEMFSFDFDK